MSRSSRRLFATVAALLPVLPLSAQQQSPPSHWEPVAVRSGPQGNPTPVEGVVWSSLVALPAGTPWLRLYFSSVHLDKGSYLRIASLRDGDFMTMRMEHMPQWGFSSCYFNGNAVLVELIAGPFTQKNFVAIDKVLAGNTDPGVLVPETICGNTDDRVPSTHAATGRIDPIGCTGWIIDLPASGNDKCHLSAGHCNSTGQVLEFAVPASGSNCGLVHPPAAKQFAINTASSQFVNGGVGNDYWVFRCFPNPTTGLTTFQEQGLAWSLSPTIPALTTTLRNYGYGLDGTSANNASGGNGSCGCSSGSGTGSRNQTQQTHTGPLVAAPGTTLNYQFDTCGGNSGSVVVHDATGLAIGIHTHGGCDTGSGANSGTQITHAGLQAAIAIVCGGASGAPNDECANAVTLLAGSNGPFQNGTATQSAPAFPCGSGVGKDLWFRLSACSGNYTISTCNATRTFDTVLQLFSGSCGALTSLGCNDDTGGACGLGSTLNLALAAGTYYIRVGGYNGASGSFALDVSSPCHGNDECSGALPLVAGLNGPFDNNAASTSPPVWACGNGANDCWFSYPVACSNSAVTIETCGQAAFDTTLEVFTGACATLTALGCNDDSCGLQSRLTVTPAAGTLYVRAGGFNGARGTFSIQVTEVPTNDACASAIAVVNGSNGPFCSRGGTTSAPAWPCGSGGNDIWFSYTAPCTGDFTATTCTAARTFDTTLEVFSGSCALLQSLGCNDDTGGGCGLGSTLSVPVQAGQSYLIRMGGFNGAVGVAELVLACVHPTDECARAAAVVDGVNGPFSTQFATTSAPAWPCGAGGNDCWFVYIAGCSAPHTFTTCTPARSFDTTLQVFDGSCAALNSLACNDDAGGTCGLGSRLTVNLTIGTPYYVRVGGFGGATGTFELAIEPGTGTGSIALHGPGCGPTTIAVSGQPRIGGTIQVQLGNVSGVPFVGYGFALGSTPFCGVCNIGHEWATASFGTAHSLFVPCTPIFIGANLGVQGADFFGAGGCPGPLLTFTSTWRVVIG